MSLGEVGECGICLETGGWVREQVVDFMCKPANINRLFGYESIGYVFPTMFNISSSPRVKNFGCFLVQDNQYAKLVKLKIQFV